MQNNISRYIKEVLANMPADWLDLTTHRLDMYEEKLAKAQFLEQFEHLFQANNADSSALAELPTAFDYIRLGHPLSCVLEWVIAKRNDVKAEQLIAFSSQTMPVLAVLRTNLLANIDTRILYQGEWPDNFDIEVIKRVYGYQFEVHQVKAGEEIPSFEGSTVFISQQDNIWEVDHALLQAVECDFWINVHPYWGSIILVVGEHNEHYVSEIQHVRRRESIAMTPINTLHALQALLGQVPRESQARNSRTLVLNSIKEITGSQTKALLASSGLSIQYAIVMGLIHNAQETYPNKAIKLIIPPNCYGGTNDQARRVAACSDQIEVVDLPVDGGKDMVQGIEIVLDKIAQEDAVPFIIVEIPTNPRVEVPDLPNLQEVLEKKRLTTNGELAVDPVFILDQTFCPNVHFLGEDDILSSVKTIAYVSGSKFPSGGKCTAGYCVSNQQAEDLMDKIDLHLQLCDNEATDFQLDVLAKQLPSMIQRIEDAYQNTREFVAFISAQLPEANINFVSGELANQGFTPSVFSLDLPTKGETEEEKESYKRELNLKLINLMIQEIPDESKFCVSYGQLHGSYWTVPATSTQGTTKEGDKDYIVRVAFSPDLDLERHKQVFLAFIKTYALREPSKMDI